MEEHLRLLGFKVKDLVTGYEGVAVSIDFDLYGCVQVAVHPGVDKDGKMQESRWFDEKRLRATSGEVVMPVPSFSVVPGAAELPVLDMLPRK
jgi:hypothetical protein